MRHFIFFYKLTDSSGHLYGECGYHSENLPSSKVLSEYITKEGSFTKGQCAILSYNEITEEDYKSFFDEGKYE